jgi:acid phosphatase
VVVVLENQDYSSVIGNSQMPFFNSMAMQHALATQFYANTHPSIGNYFMMTTGQIVTNDDAFGGTFSGDSIARQLTAVGKTWKIYAESLPSVGYTGGDVYPYIRHHNPFSYMDDVLNSASQKANIVPFSQFTSDVNNNTLPNFSLVVPNNLHNGHDCPDGTQLCLPSAKLATIDSWLSTNVGGLLQNTTFMNSSVLIVTLDESLTDVTNGGGRIPVILAGSSIKTGFQSTNTYQFPSLLRFSLNTLGVTNVPGSASGAASMGEFLK